MRQPTHAKRIAVEEGRLVHDLDQCGLPMAIVDSAVEVYRGLQAEGLPGLIEDLRIHLAVARSRGLEDVAQCIFAAMCHATAEAKGNRT